MVPAPTRSDHIGLSGKIGGCADFFASLDMEIEKAGVLDPGVFRVRNYPYLRVDRFTASFGEDVDDQAAFTAWVDRMQEIDREARGFELDNLPDSKIIALDPVNGKDGLNRAVNYCGDLLQTVDFQNADNREKLRKSISAPDDYIPLRRFVGLYPLTSWFISYRVADWHEEVRKTFSLEPPAGWQTIRYSPAGQVGSPEADQVPSETRRDPLGIPVYSPDELARLFRKWAPVWEVQTRDDHDRIGTPMWNESGDLKVDTASPLTYTLLSFTRFGKEILTQLNYIIWFPARPKENALDIYGGFLDGLNYRVTLDNNGEAILYETMHNCGCYYKAYPTARLEVLKEIDYAEPPLILKAPDIDPSRNFMTVAMESRTHYVQHLYSSPRASQIEETGYTFAHYNQLRSLSYSENRRRSMFGLDSIIPGSQRLERWILWPTGVLSPGAMRQWGRHAVAFLGMRNFDDPFMLDMMFKRSKAD
ncbi:MAG: hypothetical protein M8357_08075 [Desulfobulbaceae bacterium]|nr:hypothetical protein [Desulfobulbaceae bacterium]